MSEYTQGICMDGAAILKDGEMLTIEEILEGLRAGEEAKQQATAYRISLENLEAKKNQSAWVSVDNRLPEAFGWFLVVDGYLTEKHNVTMGFFEGNSGLWLPIDDREDTDSMRVTHWQPLPLPPTQE